MGDDQKKQDPNQPPPPDTKPVEDPKEQPAASHQDQMKEDGSPSQ